MAVMSYVTSGITKIDFEDNLFVLTEVGRDNTKDVQDLIESRGGIVKSSVTRSTNYLIYGDGEEETTKYKKALELINEKGLEIKLLPLSLFCAAGRGEGLVEFGSYPFDEDGNRKPIKWTVLKREGEKVFLLSTFGLDAKRYNERLKIVTWDNCTLRKWLNEEFFYFAFSDEEQHRIITTKVTTPGWDDTVDKVFLLSVSEAMKYLKTDYERKVVPTSYAVKKGVYRSLNDSCRWWLRSPGFGPVTVAYVDTDGNIYGIGHPANLDNRAVCPALWVDLGSDIE